MQTRSLAGLALLLLSAAPLGCAGQVEANAEEESSAQSEEPLSTGLSFVFAPQDAKLTPVSWEHREVASRRILGCMGWDVLQGTGWFPSTWYRTYTPTKQGDTYVVDLQRTIRASLCGAKMDPYNGVRVEYADVAAPEGKLVGAFAVSPDGTAPEATVTCRRNSGGDIYNTLACETAHVAVPSRGRVVVRIAWAD